MKTVMKGNDVYAEFDVVRVSGNVETVVKRHLYLNTVKPAKQVEPLPVEKRVLQNLLIEALSDAS